MNKYYVGNKLKVGAWMLNPQKVSAAILNLECFYYLVCLFLKKKGMALSLSPTPPPFPQPLCVLFRHTTYLIQYTYIHTCMYLYSTFIS